MENDWDAKEKLNKSGGNKSNSKRIENTRNEEIAKGRTRQFIVVD